MHLCLAITRVCVICMHSRRQTHCRAQLPPVVADSGIYPSETKPVCSSFEPIAVQSLSCSRCTRFGFVLNMMPALYRLGDAALCHLLCSHVCIAVLAITGLADTNVGMRHVPVMQSRAAYWPALASANFLVVCTARQNKETAADTDCIITLSVSSLADAGVMHAADVQSPPPPPSDPVLSQARLAAFSCFCKLRNAPVRQPLNCSTSAKPDTNLTNRVIFGRNIVSC